MLNFNLYHERAQTSKKEEITDHQKQLEARLKFVNLLIIKKYWSSKEINPAYYLYSVLCIDTSSLVDKNEFYQWINNYINNDYMFRNDNQDFTSILDLFIKKILTNIDNCKYMNLDGFISFLKLFVIVNSSNGNINYESVSQINLINFL